MPEVSPLVLTITALLVGGVAIGLLAKPLIRTLFGGETFVEIDGQAKPKAEPKAEPGAKSETPAKPGVTAKDGLLKRFQAPVGTASPARTEAETQPDAKPEARPVAEAKLDAEPQLQTAAAAAAPLSTATFAPEQLNPAASLARRKRRPGASLTPFRAMAGALVKKK